MAKEISFDFVKGNLPDELKNRAVKFWLDEKAITKKEDAENRSNNLLAIATIGKEVVGVATGIVAPFPQLKNKVILYRTYVSQNHRKKSIAKQLFLKTFKELNKDDELKKNGVLGILVAFYSEDLQNHFIKDKKPVLEDYQNSTFIGYDKSGIPLRISFFDNALLES